MDKSNVSFVKHEVNMLLMKIFEDAMEREVVLDNVLSEMVSDIEDTADEDFTSEDVRIALARVLYKKIIK